MSGRSAALRYLAFLAVVIGLTAVLVAIGYVPTRRLGGAVFVDAMFWGCGVSLAASALGGLPLAMAAGGGTRGVTLVFASMVLRLLAAMGLGAAALLVFAPEKKPFLLWLAISYLAQLVVDTTYATRVFRRL